MSVNDYNKQIYYILLFFAITLFVFLLKVMSGVFIPVIAAILLSCVFYPIVKKLYEKFKIPWAVGTIGMALCVVVVLLLLGTIIGTSLTAFLDQYPKYESKFLSVYKLAAEAFNFQFYDDKSFIENIWSSLKVRELVQKYAISFSSNVVVLTKTVGVILLFMVFLLIEMQLGHEKINEMFHGKTSGRVTKITKKIITDTVRFLSIKFFISLGTGLLVYFICKILRLDFAILWAFFAFVMNFIPTFGSIISVLFTTIFAFLQFYPEPFRAIFIFIFMTLINLVLGNIVEPKIEGENLGVSPFIILVSLTFWGWIWGLVGMIMAVPIMVVVKIVCENVSFLHPIAIFMGNKPSDTLKELSNDDNEEIEKNIAQ